MKRGNVTILNVPYATKTSEDYENFYAHCPWCGFNNIYNRVSDLEDTTPIGYKEVSCLNRTCGQPFAINGGLIDPAYRMLIFDCYELKEQKKYSYCILNLAQAFESFFSLYLRVHLLYRPFGKVEREDLASGGLDQLDVLASKLYEATNKYAFKDMCSVFLSCVLSGENIASLDEAERRIRVLNLNKQPPNLGASCQVCKSSRAVPLLPAV